MGVLFYSDTVKGATMSGNKKQEVQQWKFIDYFLTVAIGIMPYFALLLFFIKRPTRHKLQMLTAGLIGFAVLYIIINIL